MMRPRSMDAKNRAFAVSASLRGCARFWGMGMEHRLPPEFAGIGRWPVLVSTSGTPPLTAPVSAARSMTDAYPRCRVPFSRYFSWRGWDLDGGLRPGRYMIPKGLDNRGLARLLRSGAREAVRVRFNAARLPAEVAESVADQLALESSRHPRRHDRPSDCRAQWHRCGGLQNALYPKHL